MRKLIFALTLTLIYGTVAHALPTGRVRRVQLKADEIATVHTAVGIATIIQVPDHPDSVVVGDQEGFRVEYLDQAITIKPLRAGARSNLYVYTDSRRYNVELVTGHESVADYVVYLENPKTIPVTQHTSWLKFQKTLTSNDLTLKTKRVGRTLDGFVLIELSLESNKKLKFDPRWIWLTQDGEMRPIHRLYLSSLDLQPRNTVSGVIQFLVRDLDGNSPVRIELRREKTKFLTLPEVSRWK